jgi:omega-6 fatty acid desaturase (delta-12 desaturase)
MIVNGPAGPRRRRRLPELSRAQRQVFFARRYSLPLAIFGGLIAAYLALLCAAIAVPPLLAVPAAVLCGLSIGLLFIIGHDACHQSLTPSRPLNRLIGTVAFLPSLHPFSLWDLGHNRTHHRFNNVRGQDYVWEPLSPADYRRAPLSRRLTYRFSRSPLGIGAYYGCAIWAKRMFFVLPWKVAGGRPAYSWDLLAVWAFLPLQLSLIVTLGAALHRHSAHSILMGFALPFLVWNVLMSFVIYLHHIHPRIRWYRSIDEWRSLDGRINGTAHVRFPYVVDKLLLHIMKHNAHHYAPAVPLYNLGPLQEIVEVRGGISWRWSPREFIHVCRACKLFDYELGQWCSFESAY